MNEGESYVPPFEIGKPLEGGAMGEVVESRADGFKPGDVVVSRHGWREELREDGREADLNLTA